MRDPDIDSLLRRYRPAEPNGDLWNHITNSPNHPITKSSWPWAVAAALLLAISVGLHAAVLPPPETSSLVDAARVQAIVDQLGGSPENRTMAEWIASREAMLERERLLRASRLEPERQ
jgi:hypothetical protein